MKSFIMLCLLACSVAFAANPTTPKNCLDVKDPIDRKYCQDKKMQAFKSAYLKDKNSWKKSLSKKQKEQKTKELAEQIQQRKETIAQLQNELEFLNAHMGELKSAKVANDENKKESKKDLKSELKKMGIKI